MSETPYLRCDNCGERFDASLARLGARHEWCEKPGVGFLRLVSPGPRDPTAGATPAREETVGVMTAALATLERAAADGYPVLYPSEARALLAALRERDAAREDAARLDWLEAEGVQSIYLGEGRQLNPASQCLRAAIDAARAAAAEGRAP